jgi:guanosine-3',5'-bis(diphosphate) 3'-pyrophosphohydrolase
MGSSEPAEPLLKAIAFAAKAHRHQVRKDGQTPYVSHPFRVCLVVRHVFGVDDVRILTAAVLHDTVEDTTTDCDDIVAAFGPEVAEWVAALTKDKRLPEDRREPAFIQSFSAGGWPVHIIKLADLYDNIQDCEHLPPEKRRHSLARWKSYLDGLAPQITNESRQAFEIVSRLFAAVCAAVA